MRYLKYPIVFMMAGLFTLVSCDHEPDLPFPLHETFDNTGAFLRVVDVTSAGFDIVDLDNARFAFVGEVDDIEDGDTIENVEFYVKYIGDGVESEEVLVKTYDIADLSRHEESGLYREEFEVTATEAMNAIDGFGLDDLLIGDTFEIRWQLNLHDGRSFTRGDASGDITGGGFYNSPYFRRAGVVAAVPEDKFTGTYEFHQVEESDGLASWDFWEQSGGWLYEDSQTFKAELVVNPDNDLNGRIFVAEPVAGWEGVGDLDQPIEILLANEMENNAVTMDGDMDFGIGCTVGIAYGAETEQISHFEYDEDTNEFIDDEFTLVVYDNVNGDCGWPDGPNVTFEVTKQ